MSRQLHEYFDPFGYESEFVESCRKFHQVQVAVAVDSQSVRSQRFCGLPVCKLVCSGGFSRSPRVCFAGFEGFGSQGGRARAVVVRIARETVGEIRMLLATNLASFTIDYTSTGIF